MKKLLFILFLLCTSPAWGATTQILMGGDPHSYIDKTEPRFYCFYGAGAQASALSTYIHQVLPSGGTISNFKVKLTLSPITGNSYTFTVFKNDAATNITVTIADSATTGSDTTHVIALVPGDTLSVQSNFTESPRSAGVSWTAQFSPTIANETILMSVAQLVDDGYYYPLVSMQGSWMPNEYETQMLMPCSGTVKNLFVNLSSAPTAGQAVKILVRKNAANTTLNATVTGGVATSNNTADSFTVVAGDYLSLLEKDTNTPSISDATFGVTFVPDTAGQFILPYVNFNQTLDLGNAAFYYPTGSCGPITTWSQGSLLSDALTIKALYVDIYQYPGDGNSTLYSMYINNVDQNYNLTVRNMNHTGNITGDITVNDGDTIAFRDWGGTGLSWGPLIASFLAYIAPTGGVVQANATKTFGNARIGNARFN